MKLLMCKTGLEVKGGSALVILSTCLSARQNVPSLSNSWTYQWPRRRLPFLEWEGLFWSATQLEGNGTQCGVVSLCLTWPMDQDSPPLYPPTTWKLLLRHTRTATCILRIINLNKFYSGFSVLVFTHPQFRKNFFCLKLVFPLYRELFR